MPADGAGVGALTSPVTPNAGVGAFTVMLTLCPKIFPNALKLNPDWLNPVEFAVTVCVPVEALLLIVTSILLKTNSPASKSPTVIFLAPDVTTQSVGNM